MDVDTEFENFTLDIIVTNVTECSILFPAENCTTNFTKRCTAENVTENSIFCTSELEHAPKFIRNTLIRVVVLSVIALFAMVGNIATLTSIKRKLAKRKSSLYWLMGNLAVVDIMVTIFCIVAEAIWTYTVEWKAGNFACKFMKFFQMFTLYLSTFILVIIGFDRYSAVKFPIHKVDSVRRSKKYVLIVWILSALFSIPQAVIFRVVRGPFVEEFYQCVTYGFYTAEWQEQLYTTTSLVLNFILPLLILTFTYSCTFYTISIQKSYLVLSKQLHCRVRLMNEAVVLLKYSLVPANNFTNGSNWKENTFSDYPNAAMDEARRNLLRKAKNKALMITVVIMVAFVVCWAPYYTTMIIFIFLKPNDGLSKDLESAIFFFGSSTAMINPIIYGAFHLKRKTGRRATTNSSASSRVENTITLVALRRHKIVSTQVRFVPPSFPTENCGRQYSKLDGSQGLIMNSRNESNGGFDEQNL
ncbi:gonadotropin-releasing hormone receptor-like [Uloborus diversus]|uniref:gonadotropin-releasing hormone receptor-like n=1 Tax=Uloborus diversus TaxID=327109 RepID=UPI00240988E0|nr:gonadotropin-releasing hormone receptor-like [Uloborus diversus]